jgi:hypothetical protein
MTCNEKKGTGKTTHAVQLGFEMREGGEDALVCVHPKQAEKVAQKLLERRCAPSTSSAAAPTRRQRSGQRSTAQTNAPSHAAAICTLAVPPRPQCGDDDERLTCVRSCRAFPQLPEHVEVKAEQAHGSMRVDFALAHADGDLTLVEVKSAVGADYPEGEVPEGRTPVGVYEVARRPFERAAIFPHGSNWKPKIRVISERAIKQARIEQLGSLPVQHVDLHMCRSTALVMHVHSTGAICSAGAICSLLACR